MADDRGMDDLQKYKRDYTDEACKNIQVMNRLNQREMQALRQTEKIKDLEAKNGKLKMDLEAKIKQYALLENDFENL